MDGFVPFVVLEIAMFGCRILILCILIRGLNSYSIRFSAYLIKSLISLLLNSSITFIIAT